MVGLSWQWPMVVRAPERGVRRRRLRECCTSSIGMQAMAVRATALRGEEDPGQFGSTDFSRTDGAGWAMTHTVSL